MARNAPALRGPSSSAFIHGELSYKNILVWMGSAVDALKRPPTNGGRDLCLFMACTFLWDKGGKTRAQVRKAEQRDSGPSQHIPEICIDGSFAEEAPGVGFAGLGVWFGSLDHQTVGLPMVG